MATRRLATFALATLSVSNVVTSLEHGLDTVSRYDYTEIQEGDIWCVSGATSSSAPGALAERATSRLEGHLMSCSELPVTFSQHHKVITAPSGDRLGYDWLRLGLRISARCHLGLAMVPCRRSHWCIHPLSKDSPWALEACGASLTLLWPCGRL